MNKEHTPLFHRSPEWFELEGNLNTTQFHPPAMGDTSHQTMVPITPSNPNSKEFLPCI